MNCRIRTHPAGSSRSMKREKPLIISIAGARSWKWKRPLPLVAQPDNPDRTALLRIDRAIAGGIQRTLEARRNLGKQIAYRLSQSRLENIAYAGGKHFLQGRLIANDQGGTLQALSAVTISEQLSQHPSLSFEPRWSHGASVNVQRVVLMLECRNNS
jgi:hypothetical protein